MYLLETLLHYLLIAISIVHPILMEFNVPNYKMKSDSWKVCG